MPYKILIIQKDYNTIQGQKSWAYSYHLGLSEPFTLADNTVDCLLLEHLPYYIYRMDSYDFIIVNDIVHSLTPSSDCIYYLDRDTVIQIKRKCRFLIGTTVESVYGYGSMYKATSDLFERRTANFEANVDLFDGLMIANHRDFLELTNRGYKAIWLSPWLPVRFDLTDSLNGVSPLKNTGVFIGDMNEHRLRFVSKIQTDRFVRAHLPNEDEAIWGKILEIKNSVTSLHGITLKEYQDFLIRKIRSTKILGEMSYINAISRFGALVNLPTYFDAVQVRLMYAHFADIPYILPYSDNHPDTFLEDCIDCFFYNPEIPTTFAEVLNFVLSSDNPLVRFAVREGRNRSKRFRSEVSEGERYQEFLVSLDEGREYCEPKFYRGPQPDALRQHNYFLPAEYISREHPKYFEDPEDSRIWQPDVYGLARILCQALDNCLLIDLGCGRGFKLEKIQRESYIQTVGVDHGQNIQFCKSTHRSGVWLEANIDHKDFCLSNIVDEVSGRKECRVLVCADVIEHLAEPFWLLSEFSRCADQFSYIVMSTPERARERGVSDVGPPANPSHIREWSLDELFKILKYFNLNVLFHGLTRSNDQSNLPNTILSVIGRNDSSVVFPPYAREYCWFMTIIGERPHFVPVANIACATY